MELRFADTASASGCYLLIIRRTVFFAMTNAAVQKNERQTKSGQDGKS